MFVFAPLLLSLITQAPEAILTVDDASFYSNYGESVAIAGNWAFVGAPDDAIGGSNYVGSVYAFEKTAEGWQERQKLIASDGQLHHTFGHSLAADGELLVVGAPDVLGGTTGAVYVFRFDGQAWIEEQKVQASTGGGKDWFGWSVDLQGNRLAVGSMWSHQQGLGGGTNHAGAAWVFADNGSTWELEQELNASDMDTYDLYGASIALDGNTLVVGARGEGDTIGFEIIGYIGAAYVYELQGSFWQETQKLRANDFEEHAWFGESVAVDGSWMFVGSPGKTGGGIYGLGVAYAFVKSGGSWIEAAKLESAMPGYTQTFGHAIALEGDLALIASGGYDFLDNHQGAVHVFRREGQDWLAEPAINPGNLGPWDLFARDVDLEGSTMITGAYLESMPFQLTPGAGYVYDVAPRFHLMAQPLPLDVGEDAKLALRYATPNALSWLAYSLSGPGSTRVPQLGVTLDLANPQQLADPLRTDGTGYVKWEMPVPQRAQGQTVWLQGLQDGQVTNLLRSTIQ